jgi:integrase
VGDIDFLGKSANVVRSIVHNTSGERIGLCKTEASRKPVPLDSFMLQDLQRWRSQTEYNGSDDWVFASPHTGGRSPYWPQTILERFIRPAASAAGIGKRLGWHTFRHTCATLLKDNGEDVKVVQELLRHANSRITLDIYAQAITESKRLAQARVVAKLVPRELVQ